MKNKSLMNNIKKKNITKKVRDLMKLTGATSDSIINIAKGMIKTYHYAPEVALNVMEKQLTKRAAELHTTVRDMLAGMEKADKMTMRDYLPMIKSDSTLDVIAKQPPKVIR
jgi:hypothetical protein